MKLVFIYGMPAAGKLTVAKELAALTGYKVFHNHLVVDCLLSVFEFGSSAFVKLREQVWLAVFKEACRSGARGLIFTFSPERTVTTHFIQDALDVVSSDGGEVVFIELHCPLSELKRRMDAPSRMNYGKLTSIPLFEQLDADGVFESSQMPRPFLSLDTSTLAPSEAATKIVEALRQTPRSVI